MNEFKEWDRAIHLPVVAAAIYRELQGEGPEITPVTEKQVRARITKLAEQARFVTVETDSGQELLLRVSNVTDVEGIADPSQLRIGMRLNVLYEEQKPWNDALEVSVEP